MTFQPSSLINLCLQVVSLGETSGPKGVKVQLLSEAATDGDLQMFSTMTTDDGSFLFTPVLPGNYVIQASHSRYIAKIGHIVLIK